MAQITKLFTKGLDTDTAPHLQEKESYSSAMNVHFSLGSLLGVSDGQSGNMSGYNIGGDLGVLEPFAGNTDWTELFSTLGVTGYDQDGAKCIGYAVDDTESISNDTRFFYLFIYTPQYGTSPVNPSGSYIIKVAIKYDNTNKVNTISIANSSILLSGFWVLGPNIDNLGFLDTYFISARVSGDQLIWTDGVNPIRYVNVTTDYLSNNPTVAQLSLITEPPYAPLAPLREWIDDDPLSGTYGQIFTTGDPGYGTTVQKLPYQCTYRITNTDNFTSVLAPYSFTSLPARQEDIDTDPLVGNRITVIVPKNQIFPSNVQLIDIVFKDLTSGVNSIVRKFDINDQTVRTYYIAGPFGGPYNYTDAQAIAAHNDSSSGFQLYVNGWSGSDILETIDSATAAKQFDSLPISSKSLEVASNRLFLANNLEGYNATTTAPQVAIDTTSYLYTTAKTAYPNTMSIRVLAVPATPTSGTSRLYFCVMVRDTTANKNYSFSKEIGFPSWSYGTSLGRDMNANSIYQYLPQRISIDSLSLMKSQDDPITDATRIAIMNELNSDFASIDQSIFTFGATSTLTLFQQPTVPNTLTSFYSSADYKGVGNEQQAFMPNSSYDYGIQFYDESLRKSGVTKIGTFNTPIYNPNSRNLLEKVSITMPAGPQLDSVIPDWAHYYSITMSKNNRASSFISFIPSIMKFAYKDQNNLIVYSSIAKPGDVSSSFSYYGLAISLSELSNLGIGYSFAPGDLCDLNIYDNITSTEINITAQILTQQDGYVICLADEKQIKSYISSQSSTITYNVGAGTITYPGVSYNNAYYQSEVYVTIYTPQIDSKQLYEVSSFGSINRGVSPGTHEFGNFFDTFYFGGTNECFLIGDTYTQARNGSGSLVGLSTNTYDKGFQFWVQNISRLCPFERIGQKDLTNQIKWSNVRIPNSNYNGMATFDALDVTDVDSTVGPITSIILSSKEANLASRLVILCNSGSFVALIGQAQIYSQDQTTAFLSSAPVIGTIQPITGQWGCISPQGVISYKGMVFWADALNREIIQLAGDGATPISQQKAGFLWNQVFRNLPFDDGQYQVLSITPDTLGSGYLTAPLVTIDPPTVVGGIQATAIAVLTGGSVTSYIITNPGTGYTSTPTITVAAPPSGVTATAFIRTGNSFISAKYIKIGINPYTSEIFVTCPNPNLTAAVFPADSGNNRLNQYVPDINVSYVYNYQLNKWVGAYEDNPDQWIRVGDDVFSVGAQYGTDGLKLYKEFDSTPGLFNQLEDPKCYISFPVSEGYPATIEPLSVILMGQLLTDSTVVYARDSSTTVNNNLTQIAYWNDSNYATREGEKFAPVLRNRLSNNANQSQVLTITPLVTGSGYLTAPLVTIGPPALAGGTQATATAVLTSGSVTSYIITNPGTGYTSTPSISVAPPPTGVTATATISVGIAATNTFDYQGIKGDRIRSKTPWVQVTFPADQQINFQGVRVEVKPSSGH